MIFVNEQNGLKQNTQNGNSGVISPNNLQPNNQAQQVQNSNPGIEPLPVPSAPQAGQQVLQESNQSVEQASSQATSNAPQQVQQNGNVTPVQQAQAAPQNADIEELEPVSSNAEVLQAASTPTTPTTPIAKTKQANQPVPPKIIPSNLVANNEQENIDINPNNPVLDPISNNMGQEQVFSQSSQNVSDTSNMVNSNISEQPMMAQQPGTMGPSIPLTPGSDATQVGFVPASSEMPKKKNTSLIVAIVAIVVTALGLLGYFVIYPFVLKTFFSNPVNVYESTINEFYKGINAKTNEIIHATAIYDATLTIESNIESIKQFSGYSYGVNFGINPDKELLQLGYRITNLTNDNEYSYFNYIKDGKEYLKYSNNRGYIYNGPVNMDEASDIFASYRQLFEQANNIDTEEITYLVNKLSELTKGSINKNKLSKEDTTLNINGETTKVTNNKYEMDKEVRKETIEYIVNGLKNDDKSMEVLQHLLSMNNDQVEEYLDSLKGTSEEAAGNDVIYTFSIYTYGNKNEIIGLGMLASDQSVEFQYYNKDGYFEFDGKTSYNNEVTGKIDEQTLIVTGKQDGDRTDVKVKMNDTEILSLVITKWTDVEKDLSYSLKIGEYKINGKLSTNYDINDERIKFTFTGDANTGDEYLKVTLNINEDWTSEVANINTDNAVTLSDVELQSLINEYNNLLMQTPIGLFFTTTNGEYSNGITNYYDNQQNNFNADHTFKNSIQNAIGSNVNIMNDGA